MGFRLNIEDIIDELIIYGQEQVMNLLFGEMSVRCPVTQVNQSTGKRRTDKEPLKWTAANRPPRPDVNKATFGINTVFPLVESGKIISVRDRIVIVKEK